MVATVTNTHIWNSVYGNILFNNKLYPNMIIEYEMELDIAPGCGAIGISSVGHETDNFSTLIWNQHNADHRHKAVYTFHNSSTYYKGGCGKPYGAICRHDHNDKIRMTIDIPNKSLIYWSIKQKKKLAKYIDIDYSITYRFAMSLTGRHSLKLTNFTIRNAEE